MSEVNRLIRLKPDPAGNAREVLVSVGHRCEHCRGNGWLWGKAVSGEYVKVPCKVCGGKAELDAIISITWKPTCKE